MSQFSVDEEHTQTRTAVLPADVEPKPWMFIEPPFGGWRVHADRPSIAYDGVAYEVHNEAGALAYTSQVAHNRAAMAAAGRFVSALKKYWV